MKKKWKLDKSNHFVALYEGKAVSNLQYSVTYILFLERKKNDIV